MIQEDQRSLIRRILLEDWDPHDVAKRPEAHGAYDGWVEPLLELSRSGAYEARVMEWLAERERETMCFPGLGRERLRRVARKLGQIGRCGPLIPGAGGE